MEFVENLRDFDGNVAKESGKGGWSSGNSRPYIRRPQEEFQIVANNLNEPFKHVWLERTADGSRYVHPLEKFPASEFIDKDVGCIKAVKSLPIERTPFKLVEDVKELKLLADRLKLVNEFAVDLEHNAFRSFQGLTCLMQISTRGEDYIVDTLKLRIHVGPQLREVFKDPDKKKVMHGADNDVMWLQRDFGIYICNLFDTHQAAKILNLGKNSLAFLLLYFCGVTVNKEHQKSDWRIRPLPNDMMRYARDDTHYLLYLYDLVRLRLLSAPTGAANLSQVNRLSYELCKKLYEKKLCNSTSYLYIYGIETFEFNCVQFAVLSGLYEWRDRVARHRDENIGYILPNQTVLEIARRIPLTVNELQECLQNSSHNVHSDLYSIVELIKTSTKSADSFVNAAQSLKDIIRKRARGDKMAVDETSKIQDGNKLNPQSESFTVSEQGRCTLTDNGNPDLTKYFRKTVEVLYPPSNDFRPGSSTSNSQLETELDVIEQKYRVDNGEEGIEMKREITNCLSASEHVNVKEDISCQQKRSNSVEEGSRTSTEENGVKIMKGEAFVHVNEEVSWQQNRSDSVEDSSRMSDVETDSVEDGSSSTSEQESTECSISQGSSGEVEEIGTEEISGATEEVVNNRSQGFRMESLITNSEIDSSSNGNKERTNSSNGIEGTKDEGTASTIRSYFQFQPFSISTIRSYFQLPPFNRSTVLSYFQLKPVGAYTVSEAECSIYISIVNFCERVTPARILECTL